MNCADCEPLVSAIACSRLLAAVRDLTSMRIWFKNIENRPVAEIELEVD